MNEESAVYQDRLIILRVHSHNCTKTLQIKKRKLKKKTNNGAYKTLDENCVCHPFGHKKWILKFQATIQI